MGGIRKSANTKDITEASKTSANAGKRFKRARAPLHLCIPIQQTYTNAVNITELTLKQLCERVRKSVNVS